MASASPTQLTLRYLREQGWLAQVVERWLPTREPGIEARREEIAEILRMISTARDHARQLPVEAGNENGRIIHETADNAFEWLWNRVGERTPPQVSGSPGRRVDLFGLIDVLCLDGQPGCLGVQCCAYSGVSAHVKEIRDGLVKMPAPSTGKPACEVSKRLLAKRWLAAGNRLSIFGWRKVDGKWTPRIVEITAELLGG
jgi:hypothetical protein